MDEEKKKDGVSVKEIEGYAKKHRFELFFCILFVLACLFTLVFWGPAISIFLAGIGGILSVLMPTKVNELAHKVAHTILHKDGTTQLIIAIAVLIVAIFLAPVVFFFVGLHAGKGMMRLIHDALGGQGSQ